MKEGVWGLVGVADLPQFYRGLSNEVSSRDEIANTDTKGHRHSARSMETLIP
jgi:hypothetical protein